MTRIYTIDTAFTSARIHRNFDGDLTLLNTLFGGALAMEQSAKATPLTQWTGDYWGNPRMTPAQAMTKWGVTNQRPISNIAPGDINPFFRFIDDVTKTGNVINRGSEVTTLTMINEDDMNWMKGDVGRVLLLCSLPNGEVDGLPVYFVVPEANYEDNMPAGFFNSAITEPDPEDEEQTITRQRKWSEWKSPNHTHELIDGNYYIPSTSWGVHMKASQWVPFVLGGLLTAVIDKPEVVVE